MRPVQEQLKCATSEEKIRRIIVIIMSEKINNIHTVCLRRKKHKTNFGFVGGKKVKPSLFKSIF